MKKIDSSIFEKWVDRVAQACSGPVRLEQCECRTAKERGDIGASVWYRTTGPSVSAP